MIPIDPTPGAADTSPQAAPARMDAFRADRVYLGADHARNERRTWIVTAICAATLAAQLIGGLAFKSMALTAAGLHMAAHVAVLLVAALAYRVSRQRKDDPRYAFGTGKIGFLAGFANAVVLAATAFLIALESIERLIEPAAVDYDSALPLAAAGLVVTMVCAWLLKPARAAHDGDGDLNLSAAHLHLSADALVGVLTLAGLAAGRSLGWSWADPAAGLVGAALVAQFAWSLLRRTGGVLLDMNPSPALVAEIRARLQAQGERVVDLHLWRLGPGHHAAIVVLEAAQPQDVQAYRARLAGLAGLSHLTIEVRRA
ncbi:MAG: cation diffusion facilitator family transporter [Phenylobacterium sp.]|uniref:cation diffusion facilitator family transporter n=1 Tax=Phenylobacterium sp. TaxID=1871053 RepID=UPI0027363A15|nr:cation diffusion facilitator family transporter [Phenylobacterium sp.]MDP3175576.1 cation diffusion facilitator family transporter [Phenylobacterium sp.]